MIICLVTEFPQHQYQWYMAWDDDRQIKSDVVVRSVMVSPETLRIYPKDHGYWTYLREADFVFVCVSRAHFGINWKWFELPILAKRYMKPDAKMACIFDQDFVWLFHKNWAWWDDYDSNPMFQEVYAKTPEQFFKESGVLEVADIYFSVIDDPPYKPYTSKPVIYIPLPQLVSERTAKTLGCKFLTSRNGHIALLNHSSQSTSIEHTLRNIIRKVGTPVGIFNTISYRKPYRGKLWTAKHGLPAGSVSWGRFNPKEYKNTLEKYYIAIDDSANYIGWSRFAMECALAYVPCIGSNKACKVFFPELYTKHKDYKRQMELVKKLYGDPTFHHEVALKAYQKVYEHLDSDVLCNKLLEVAREIGSPDTKVDVEKKVFLDFLVNILVGGKMIPPRPSKTGTIYDNLYYKSINQAQWDGLYGKWWKYIKDEGKYRKLIAEAQKLLRQGYKVIRKL